MVEFVLGRKSVSTALPPRRGARQQRRQPVIVLRSDDEIDRRRTADDFLALGLRHAACNRNDELSGPRPPPPP